MIRILIIASTICILYITMQDTLSNILLEDDVVELMELNEKENEEENEKELWKEFEFLHNLISRLASRQDQTSICHNSFNNLNKYNSPIRAVITPPPIV